MVQPRTIRFMRASVLGWLGVLVVCMALALIQARAQTPPSPSPVVLDRVVAVVNNQAILLSDVDAEMHLSVLEPNESGNGSETAQDALRRLISRALIRQQIREEDLQATAPTQKEIAARLALLREELPICMRQNCTTDAGWKAFLTNHDLTQQQVENYLRGRLEILHFIELRFRPGISISHREIETYYKGTLLPQYPQGETPPPLDQVAPRIEEILLQQHVNALFTGWLDNLRSQGEIEVLDPALEAAATPLPRGAGTQ